MSQTDHTQLFYEFLNEQGRTERYDFTNPIEIISAVRIEQVMPALKKVRFYTESGYYAAGYVSYEAAPAFDPAFRVHTAPKLPLLWFGIYEKSVPVETDGFRGNSSFQLNEWTMDTDYSAYQDKVSRIKQEISDGATYQTNFTMRMNSAFRGDNHAFYKKITETQSGYHAYLNLGRYRILSASPELFFRWNGHRIVTRPMKGTSGRGRWSEEDRALASRLFHSEKERAENVMIVDLLRNDLGTIAKPGSVRVSKLFDIERYPTVLQMTSTVEAETKEDVKLEDVFRALFPCGSVTGAPKVNTMSLIHELEDSPREVYCGALGFVKPGGEAVFNVPIRTVAVDADLGKAMYGVGGGITWDSTPEGEYREAATKAKMLTEDQPEFELLESLKLEDGNYDLLERHLQRLKASGEYFLFAIDLDRVKQRLKDFADAHPSGFYKVRLLAAYDGSIFVEGNPAQPLDNTYEIEL
ncbi:MAG TPA: aminodeoxychorismate synthase component I, partial [Bacillales bacterium]|nr:aminodeoxychorismate synthase component I [Bacillales bacterium]